MNSHSELRKSILWFTENHPDIEVDLDATGEDGRVIHTLYVKGEEVSEHETLSALYIDLTRDHGAQYAEVVECNCLFPFEHSEE